MKTENETIKVCAIQMSCSSSNLDINLEKATNYVRRAAKAGNEIVLLPELFHMQYSSFLRNDAELFNYAEMIPGSTSGLLAEIAAEYEIYVIVPLFEKVSSGVYYNTAAVISPKGDILAKYRKVQIPCRHGWEKFYFRPGPIVGAVPTPKCKIGVVVCYDLFYPEMFRLLSFGGAKIVFVPAAALWDKETWKIVLRTRALESGVFVVASNRVGEENGTKCFGTSLIINPEGKIIAEADDSEEVIISADLSLSDIDRVQIDWAFLRDLRPEIYQEIEKTLENVYDVSKDTNYDDT